MRWRAVLIVLCAVPSFARGELQPIRAYTTADGLAAGRVNRIVPDSRGFLWFCTPEGLSRYDGYHFVTYGVRDGLASRAVSTMVVTRAGEHLVGTTRGMSRINSTGQSSRFATFAPEPEAAKDSVADLLNARSGKVWCATRGGLFEWNAASGFRRRQFSLRPQLEIHSIVESSDGDLWVGTAAGMFLLRGSEIVQTLAVKDGLPGNWVEKMLIDSSGRLWAALRGGLALIGRRATGEWRVEKAFTKESGLIGSDVKAVVEASDGTLWVGTTQGISRLGLAAGKPVVLQNLTRSQGLSDRHITALAEDQAGNIWAGTEGAGVMRIDRVGFTTYREQDGLPTDRVFSVVEDQAGELLALTAGEVEGVIRSGSLMEPGSTT